MYLTKHRTGGKFGALLDTSPYFFADVDGVPWIRPDPGISRKAIDRAGNVLCGRVDATEEERSAAFYLIGNWRMSHSYPLNAIRQTLLNRAVRVESAATVSQRLKRMSSIDAKLRHSDNPNMKMTQMQDIGGCRAVLSTVAEVDQLVRVYERAAAQSETATREKDRGSEFIRKDDYLEAPKPTGYRGVHLIYKYRSSAPRNEVWNGMRVEIQIRSALQHAWATAVETVSTFTQQQLKANVGDDRWKRFFALMGTAIAREEGRSAVPDTPTDPANLALEIHELTTALKASTVLAGFPKAVEIIQGDPPSNASYYLLVLNAETREIRITGYTAREQGRASDELLAAERAAESNPDLNAVLASVESLAALQIAFPNYFLDIDAFSRVLQRTLRAGADAVQAMAAALRDGE